LKWDGGDMEYLRKRIGNFLVNYRPMNDEEIKAWLKGWESKHKEEYPKDKWEKEVQWYKETTGRDISGLYHYR